MERQMPVYGPASSRVYALRIQKVVENTDHSVTLHFVEDGYAPMVQREEWKKTFAPSQGDYLVCNPTGVFFTLNADTFLQIFALVNPADLPAEEPKIETGVAVPELDIDKYFFDQYGTPVSMNGQIERSIVANLIAHLEAANFKISKVDDGDALVSVYNAKSAMELIFNLEDCQLYVHKESFNTMFHQIRLTPGNGIDIVRDWTYSQEDEDGFNRTMNEFDAEKFA